jgi:hypothetical protein
VIQELTGLGLLNLPSCQHLKSTEARKALEKARASGDIVRLRAAVRGARIQVGFEDPVVQKVGKLLCKAEHCIRACRDSLARDRLHEIPASLHALEFAILQLKMLGLGPGLWEDPFIANAWEKVVQWRAHKNTVENFLGRLREGPDAFCTAWAEFALSDSPAKMAFGDSITKELLKLPDDVGITLVTALDKAVQEEKARESTLLETEVDEYEFIVLRLMRISCLLCNLDKADLDKLVLRCDDQGGMAFAQSAKQQDSIVFYAMYQALSCELVTIRPELQRRLRKFGPVGIESPALRESEQLCKELSAWISTASSAPSHSTFQRIRPTDLCIQRLPAGGLAVRLFPETGLHPNAQQAQTLLGSGSSAIATYRPTELDKWSQANSVRRPFETIDRCRVTRDTLAQARNMLDDATRNHWAADADFAMSEAKSAHCAAWKVAAQEEARDAQECEMKTMVASREAMMAQAMENAPENAIELWDIAKKADQEAQVRHHYAKEDLKAAIRAVEQVSVWKERAAAAASKFAAEFEAATKAEQVASEEAAAAVESYTVMKRGPIYPRFERS